MAKRENNKPQSTLAMAKVMLDQYKPSKWYGPIRLDRSTTTPLKVTYKRSAKAALQDLQRPDSSPYTAKRNRVNERIRELEEQAKSIKKAYNSKTVTSGYYESTFYKEVHQPIIEVLRTEVRTACVEELKKTTEEEDDENFLAAAQALTHQMKGDTSLPAPIRGHAEAIYAQIMAANSLKSTGESDAPLLRGQIQDLLKGVKAGAQRTTQPTHVPLRNELPYVRGQGNTPDPK